MTNQSSQLEKFISHFLDFAIEYMVNVNLLVLCFGSYGKYIFNNVFNINDLQKWKKINK